MYIPHVVGFSLDKSAINNINSNNNDDNTDTTITTTTTTTTNSNNDNSNNNVNTHGRRLLRISAGQRAWGQGERPSRRCENMVGVNMVGVTIMLFACVLRLLC